MNYGNRQHAQATQENGPEERERLRDKEWKRKEIKPKQKRQKNKKQSTKTINKKKQRGISYMIKLTESFLVRGIVLLSRTTLLYFLTFPPLPPPEALPG